MKKNKHSGSSFDSFLKKEKIKLPSKKGLKKARKEFQKLYKKTPGQELIDSVAEALKYEKNRKTFCIDCGTKTVPGPGSARCKECWDDKLGRN
jgi:predicted Zn-dependent protease